MGNEYDKIERKIQGFKATVKCFYDEFMGMPWEEHEGHGIIRTVVAPYGRPEKKPGEVIMWSERNTYWLYDFSETMKKAKSEGWGCRDSEGLTPGQIREKAVREDMRYCRDFLTGARYWVGYRLSVVDNYGVEVGEDSCWGFDDQEYMVYEAFSIAEALIGRETLKREKEKAESEYWASRDVLTVE